MNVTGIFDDVISILENLYSKPIKEVSNRHKGHHCSSKFSFNKTFEQPRSQPLFPLLWIEFWSLWWSRRKSRSHHWLIWKFPKLCLNHVSKQIAKFTKRRYDWSPCQTQVLVTLSRIIRKEWLSIIPERLINLFS